MTSSRLSITIDCRDPKALVAFWCAALGYVPEPPPHGHVSWLAYWQAMGIPHDELQGIDDSTCDSIVDPLGTGPRIWFQVVPEVKVRKNRVHLDIDVTDGRRGDVASRRETVDRAAVRLMTVGAQHVATHAPEGADYYAVVMADPEGNEFCLS
jgi:hypothetical protein